MKHTETGTTNAWKILDKQKVSLALRHGPGPATRALTGSGHRLEHPPITPDPGARRIPCCLQEASSRGATSANPSMDAASDT